MSTAPRPREQPEFTRWLSAVSLATAVVCGTVVALLGDGALRFLFVGIAMLTLPGLAICVALRPRDLAALGALTLGSSLATWTVVAQAMALLDTWNPPRVFAGIVGVSAVWSLVHVVLDRRDPESRVGSTGTNAAAASAARVARSDANASLILRLFPVVIGAAAVACFVVPVRDTEPTSSPGAA